jgi:hypothetical protein
MSRFVSALVLALVLVPAAAAQRATPMVTVGAAASGANGLHIAASPTRGALPLTVTFTLDAPKTASWRLDFGDGRSEAATGQPPATVKHVYRTKGSFVAHLSTEYPAVTTVIPAQTTKAAPRPSPAVPSRLAGPLVILGVVPGSAASPRTVHFTLASMFTGDVTSWQVVFGDGKQAGGKGAPPSSVAHTYTRGGTFRAYVVLSEATADRYTRLQIPAKGLAVTVR